MANGDGWRMVWALLALILLVQLALPLLLLVTRDRMMFFPAPWPRAADGLTRIDGVDASLFEARREDGLLLTGYDARLHDSPAAPALLFLHGNAGNAALRAPWLGQFAQDSGLRVVLASYAGYGGNEGHPSEHGIHMDARAFYERLVADGVDPRQIVLYGESIGSAPALRLAREHPSAGVIVQSPFYSLASMTRRVYPWLPLVSVIARGRFSNAEDAAALDVPLLIVHGTADDIIPFAEGERLRSAVPDAEFMPIHGAGHNDLFAVGGRDYAATIGQLVREWTEDP